MDDQVRCLSTSFHCKLWSLHHRIGVLALSIKHGTCGVPLHCNLTFQRKLLIIDLTDTQSTGPAEPLEVEPLPLKVESICHVSVKRECFCLHASILAESLTFVAVRLKLVRPVLLAFMAYFPESSFGGPGASEATDEGVHQDILATSSGPQMRICHNQHS